MSEAALHNLTATLLEVLTLRAFHTLPVAMKRGFCLLIFIGPDPLPTLTFRDVTSNAEFRAALEHFVGVIARDSPCPPQLVNNATSGMVRLDVVKAAIQCGTNLSSIYGSSPPLEPYLPEAYQEADLQDAQSSLKSELTIHVVELASYRVSTAL